MTPEKTRAVLFDLDGTLADTAPDLGFALNEQRRLHGLSPLSLEEIRPQASHGARGLLQLGFNLSPEDDTFTAMRDEYLKLYETHICLHTRLFPGISELLENLENRGIHWGIVTNKPARFTLPLMTQLGLAQRASCIISGDTTAHSKPHPEPMFAAAREVGATPASCLYLGDAERDVEAALAAGMTALIANYGYLGADDQPDNWGAYARIDAPQDILAFLA